MKSIEDVDVKNKRVLVRADLNIAVGDKLENTGILKESAKTINYLMENGAKIILMSDIGESTNGLRRHFRSTNVAYELEKLLGIHIEDIEDVIGDIALESTSSMAAGEIVLLENLGFHKEEYWNDDAFALVLSRLADIYVNDDFRTANKEYASNVGITKHLPSYAGLSLKDELNKMSDFINNIQSPFVILMGGIEPEKKMPVLERFLPVADYVLATGEIALAFLQAQGQNTGDYTLSDTAVNMAMQVLSDAEKEKCRIICPIDFLVAKEIAEDAENKKVSTSEIPEDWFVVDIGPRTIEKFNKIIYDAQTVLWNGPVGVYEISHFGYGTRAMVQSMESTGAKTIAGGVDTVNCIHKYGKPSNIDIISYGGDSFLSYIKAENLPGIEALG